MSEQTEQEPVATKLESHQFTAFHVSADDFKKLQKLPTGTKIYTSPPKREQELETLVKDFFENYLDTWEESDSGREFHPITISCCRCMKVEPLDKLLTRMRELSGAKSPYEIGSSM